MTQLTNLKISQDYKDSSFYLSLKDFTSAITYWIVRQSPYESPEIQQALNAFTKKIKKRLKYTHREHFIKLSYNRVNKLITEEYLMSIPEIAILNERKNGKQGMQFVTRFSKTKDPDNDFIDIGALARNTFYMIIREAIH